MQHTATRCKTFDIAGSQGLSVGQFVSLQDIPHPFYCCPLQQTPKLLAPKLHKLHGN